MRWPTGSGSSRAYYDIVADVPPPFNNLFALAGAPRSWLAGLAEDARAVAHPNVVPDVPYPLPVGGCTVGTTEAFPDRRWRPTVTWSELKPAARASASPMPRSPSSA